MQVLVSVSSVHEAHMALSAGIRLIDLKETSYGALAALELELSQSIVDAVNDYRHQYSQTDIVVSATIGDDCLSAIQLVELIQSRLNIGIDVIKLPETIWRNQACHEAINTFISKRVKLIAVLTPASLSAQISIENTLQDLAKAGYWGAMIDTTQKSRSLTTIVNMDMLAFFVRSAKKINLYTGLAGSLRIEEFDSLAELSPDYLGFRSGLCFDQRREQSLNPEKVHLLVSKLSEFC